MGQSGGSQLRVLTLNTEHCYPQMGRNCCGDRQSPQRPATEGMDRKYIPSEDIGDYEEYRKKKSPKKGPLYPLDEEGAYGAPPAAPAALPPPLPGYQKRERKAKVYASYAVSSDCCMHGDKLEQNETDRGKTPPRTVRKKSSTPSYNSLPRQERSSSQSGARSHSVRLPSPAPSIDSYASRPTNWKNSLRSSESPARSYRGISAPRRTTRRQTPSESVSPNRDEYASKSPERKTRQSQSPEHSLPVGRRSLSSDGMSTRSSQSSTDWGYTSYSSFTADRQSSKTTTKQTQQSSSSSSKYSSSARNTSFDEADDQDYGYGGQGNGHGTISLGTLKTPEITPWDNMGILGLSSKMYSDTSIMKQGIFSSSSLIRKESESSHAM